MIAQIKYAALALMLGVLIFTSASWLWDWWENGRHEIRSDDAYIAGDITAVAARVSGHVTELFFDDNSVVQQGQLLLRLDDQAFQAAVAHAQALLSEAQAGLAALMDERQIQQALVTQAEAKHHEVKAQLELAQLTHQRALKLIHNNAISAAELDQTQAQLTQAEAALRSAAAGKLVAVKQLQHLNSQYEVKRANIAATEAALQSAQVDLNSTYIFAPISGVVGNRSVHIGRYINNGSRLLNIVAMDNLWVEANLREDQIQTIQAGQPVRIQVDGFPKAIVDGVVDSIAPGTGAVFSLFPPDNATGNFVRIVQRVPVKIRIINMPNYIRLAPGLSARVAIRVNNTNSLEHPFSTPKPPHQTLLKISQLL